MLQQSSRSFFQTRVLCAYSQKLTRPRPFLHDGEVKVLKSKLEAQPQWMSCVGSVS